MHSQHAALTAAHHSDDAALKPVTDGIANDVPRHAFRAARDPLTGGVVVLDCSSARLKRRNENCSSASSSAWVRGRNCRRRWAGQLIRHIPQLG